MYIGLGASKFLGVRRILDRISKLAYYVLWDFAYTICPQKSEAMKTFI